MFALCLFLISCDPGGGSPGGQDGAPDEDPDSALLSVDSFFWGRWVTARAGTSSALYSLSIDDDTVRVRERVWVDGAWSERDKDTLKIDSATSTGLRAEREGYVEALSLARAGSSDSGLVMTSDPWGIGKSYLSRDGGYSGGSSFSFSLLKNGTAAGRVLLPASSISLTIRNTLNAQAQIAATANPDATVSAGPFVPGDEYEVSAAGQSFFVRPDKEGVDLGDLVLTSHDYNFKIVPSFVDISGPPVKGVAPRLADAILAGNTEDFLYPDTDYAVRFELWNHGAAASKPASVSLSLPAGLSVLLAAGSSLPAIAAGSHAALDGTCRASGLAFGDEDYVDLRLGFDIATVDDEWSDAVTLRVYKERMYLVARAPAGAFVSPERRSLAFEGYFDGYLPRRSAGYLLSLYPDPYGTVASGYAAAVEVDESFDAPGAAAAVDGNGTEAGADALRENEVRFGATSLGATDDPVDFLRVVPPAEDAPAFSAAVAIAPDLPAASEPRILAVRGGAMVVSYLSGSVRRARAYVDSGGTWGAVAEPPAVAGAGGASALAAAIRADGSFAVLYLDSGSLRAWLGGSSTFGTVAGSAGAVGGIVVATASSFAYVWETRDGSSRPSLWCDGTIVGAYSAYNLKLVSYDAAIGEDGAAWIAVAEGTAGTYGQTAVFRRAAGSSTWTKEDRTSGFNNTTTTYDNLASESGDVSAIDLALDAGGIPRLVAFQKPVGGYAFSPSLASRSGAGATAAWSFDASLGRTGTTPRLIIGKDPSIAYDSTGAAHIAYREGTRPVYLAKPGGSWVTRHLAPRGGAEGRVLVDLGAAGSPAVYWYDPRAGAVMRAAKAP